MCVNAQRRWGVSVSEAVNYYDESDGRVVCRTWGDTIGIVMFVDLIGEEMRRFFQSRMFPSRKDGLQVGVPSEE